MSFPKPANTPRRMTTTLPPPTTMMREKATTTCGTGEDDGSDDNAAEDEAMEAEEKRQNRRLNGGRRGGGISCQAEKCTADLTEAKRYHRRHKVCEYHAKAPSVLVAGLRQRFCQQCSRFHELSEFDEAKRSCRRRLAGHNERRRKAVTEPQPQLQGEATSSSSTGRSKGAHPNCRAPDHETAARVTPMSYSTGNPAAYKFQIR